MRARALPDAGARGRAVCLLLLLVVLMASARVARGEEGEVGGGLCMCVWGGGRGIFVCWVVWGAGEASRFGGAPARARCRRPARQRRVCALMLKTKPIYMLDY